MKLDGTIKVLGDSKNLKKLFLSEKRDSKNDRAKYSTSIKGEEFIIHIQAEDSTAFRAISNSILKLIIVYEKTKEVVENEN